MTFYVVDGDDRVVAASEFPAPDVGAPMPAVAGDEGTVFLTYLVDEFDPAWDGTYATVVGPDTAGRVAVVELSGADLYWGWPNDDLLDEHPLADRGLERYAVWEVRDSSWIRALERGNSAHPMHRPESFDGLRHLVFAFHDTTFECVVRDVGVEVVAGPMRRVVADLAASLYDR